MDYSKMSDVDMSREVAKALKLPWSWNGGKTVFVADDTAIGRHSFDPCNNPADAWPIIVESGISINHYNGVWEASFEWDAPVGAFGTEETVTTSTEHKNPLRAAMVAYLMMREVNNVQTDSTR
ncbi:TPA: DUF2591 domain-containing protein [Enterobacter roggenkampii]|nr:DUF2591 domain-containing protein [Enterobacter roggenkampii]